MHLFFHQEKWHTSDSGNHKKTILAFFIFTKQKFIDMQSQSSSLSDSTLKMSVGHNTLSSTPSILCLIFCIYHETKNSFFWQKMTYVCHIHCPLMAPRWTLQPLGLRLGSPVGIRHVGADQSSSNYLVRANFRVKIMKALAHRNVWPPAGTFGSDRTNPKI